MFSAKCVRQVVKYTIFAPRVFSYYRPKAWTNVQTRDIVNVHGINAS